jgi:hypothetical protein
MKNPRRYFYRCFSNSSAGGLISGKGRRRTRLSDDELYTEFSSHVLYPTKKPTALISVSSRIIDTLRRAFGKFHNDGEKPDQIWIAFVHVPDEDTHLYHHAEGLAYQTQADSPRRLRYEYLFEWEIPKRYLIHKVSVATLLRRGFSMEPYLVDKKLPPTSILRKQFASFFDPSNGGYSIGLELGSLVRPFGARAPLYQIALQIQLDCSSMDIDNQIVECSYGENQVHYLDSADIRDIEEGVEIALVDCWLLNSEFLDKYEEHSAWGLQVDAEVEEEWNLSLQGYDDYRRYKKNKQRAIQAIEEAAIELGL